MTSRSWLTLALGLLGAACGSAPPRPLLGDNDLVTAGEQRCSMARPGKPYLIKLPATERGELEARLRRGLVLVRYSGCMMEVVDDCDAPKNLAYSYVGVTPKEDEVHIRNTNELYAAIPIGAADLAAKLQSSGELRIASKIAGRYESPATTVRLSTLVGSGCQTATHGIKAITIGAFRLTAGASSTSGAGVGVLGVKAGSESSQSEDELSKDGDFDACGSGGAKDAPPDGCGALIRAELIRVDQSPDESVTKAERVCPAGMEFVEYRGCQPIKDSNETDETETSDADRFVQKGGSVFDTTTGLSWQRDPPLSTVPWEQAKQYCLSLMIDGATGWRLPRKRELSTLIDKQQKGPKIDTRVFTTAPAAAFWTLSPDSSSPGDAWSVDFFNGAEKSQGSGTSLYVRCVH